MDNNEVMTVHSRVVIFPTPNNPAVDVLYVPSTTVSTTHFGGYYPFASRGSNAP